MHELSDEELLAAIAAGPGFLPEFYRRHVAVLYGLAGNVAAGMRRQQQRLTDAEHRLAGRALLDADDYARVEERIDAASALRRAFEAMQQLGDKDRRLLELVAVDGLTTGEAAKVLGVTAVATRVRLLRSRTRLRALLSAADQPVPASPTLAKEERA